MIPFSYSVRNLAVRKATTVATAAGISMVVFVFASALMLHRGISRTLGKSGRPDRAIILRQGSDSELGSTIDEARLADLAADDIAGLHAQGYLGPAYTMLASLGHIYGMIDRRNQRRAGGA